MNNKLIDMSGMTFGFLTVVCKGVSRKSPSGNIITRWKCKCKCGNEIEVDAYALRSGNTKSCGCEKYGKGLKDISGKKFGLLTVEKLDHIADNKTYWLCKCKCGNMTVVPKCNLENGNTKSCGCLHSYGESVMEKMFIKHGIKYIHNYRFENLRGPKGGQLIFDYAIIDNQNNVLGLIEYQGIQHYIDTDFGKQQREVTDKQKKYYCDKNNIHLFYIKYDEDIEFEVLKIFLECMSMSCQAPAMEKV